MRDKSPEVSSFSHSKFLSVSPQLQPGSTPPPSHTIHPPYSLGLVAYIEMNVPTLNMSNILHNDSLLFSPVSEWEHSTSVDNFSLNFNAMSSASSYSPLPTARMLRNRYSPEGSEPEHQMCVSTHQVFDVPPPSVESSPAPEMPDSPQPSPQPSPAVVVPSKRPSTSTPVPAKKPRPSGDRITTKDFIPPDVSGLSKREARLVKNRAAAFLSRQRKREEFECMEVRVAELEQENARLHALAGSGKQEEPQEELLSEVEQLRRQLAAAEQRERELSAELSKTAAQSQPVKMEAFEPVLPLPSRSISTQPQTKSGASLGLMVLLCALPTLLSVPTHSTLPTTFSFPITDPSCATSSSSFDMNSIVPGDFDWAFNSASSIMDLDVDANGRVSGSSSMSTSSKKLEFVDADSQALGLNGLDISFDAMASQDGKIRVRIHPPPTSSSSTTAASSPEAHSDSDDQSMWGGSDSGAPTSGTQTPSLDADPLGPFLGFGGDYSLDSMSHLSGMSVDSGDLSGLSYSPPSFDFGSSFGSSDVFGSSSGSSGKRRVRIALKSLPGEGSEGGEWEVQVC